MKDKPQPPIDEAAAWQNLSPQERFAMVFGVNAQDATPEEVFTTIRTRFDAFNRFRRALSEFGAGRDRHDNALRRVGARNYSEFEQKGGVVFGALERSLEAVQPFVQEDLGFIQKLARNEGSTADFETMVTYWQTSDVGNQFRVTEAQKKVLRGEITLRKEPPTESPATSSPSERR